MLHNTQDFIQMHARLQRSIDFLRRRRRRHFRGEYCARGVRVERKQYVVYLRINGFQVKSSQDKKYAQFSRLPTYYYSGFYNIPLLLRRRAKSEKIKNR